MSYTLAYTGAEIDALLGKIDAIFVAEYGSTIYSEVTAAIAAGNKVIVANAGKVYVYAGQDDNSGYVFTQSGPNAAKPNATYVTLSTGNVWSTATVDLATLQQFYASLMEDTASGSIASFPDGAEDVPVESLVVKIEAMQAGSGDPAPDNIRPIYSQAEKNVLPFDLDTIKSLNTSGTWSGNSYTYRTVVCTVKEDGELEIRGTATGGAFDLVYGEVELSAVPYILSSGALVGNASYLQLLATGISDINTKNGELTFTPPAVTATARVHINSGTTVNSLCSPMLRDAANPDPTFVPYRCVARVDVVGKNLFNKATVTTGKGIDADSNVVNSGASLVSDFIKVNAGNTYYLTCTNDLGNRRVGFYDKNRSPMTASDAAVGSRSFTVPSGAEYCRVSVGIGDADNTQVELGSTGTPIEAFKDRTYFVMGNDTSPTEIYGGELNVTTGELKVTYGELDLGTLGWTTNQGAFYYGVNAGWKSSADGECEIYQIIPETAIGSSPNNSVQMRAGGIYIKDARYTVAADFKTAVSGIMLYYELTTPQTYQLDPVEVKTWLATNNITANTGDIKLLVYRCNTALYLEKKLGGNVQTLSMSRTAPTLGKSVAADLGSLEEEHPELDELTEAPELEPYEEPEAEEPEELEELTEEPEAESAEEPETTEEAEEPAEE